MNAISLAAGFALVSIALPAVAGPWQHNVSGGENQYHAALQVDQTGEFTLAVSCTEGIGEYTMFVITPFNWDTSTSYAPEVPVTFSVDGSSYSDLPFVFANASGREIIAVDATDWPREFATILIAFGYATGEIEFQYFDNRLTFVSDGLPAVLAALAEKCL